jgi:hypothetical protein
LLRDGRIAMRQRTAALVAGVRTGLIAPLIWRRELRGMLLLFNRRQAALTRSVVESAEVAADLLGALLAPRLLNRPERKTVVELPPRPVRVEEPRQIEPPAYAPLLPVKAPGVV